MTPLPRALLFDTFGTVVDWHGSIAREWNALARAKGLKVTGARVASLWRAGYHPAMNRVRTGELGWTKLDGLHRLMLDDVLAQLGLTDALTAAKMGVTSIEHLTGVPEAAGRADLLFAAAQDGFFAGWTAFEKSWATLDSVTLNHMAGQLAETGVTMVPTLVLHEVFSRLDDTAAAANPDLLDLPANQMAAWNMPAMIERAGWTSC